MGEETGTGSSLWMKNKSRFLKAVLAAAVLLAVVLGVFFKGYTSAEEKYKAVINELEAEKEAVSDPDPEPDTIIQEEVIPKVVNIESIRTEIRDIGELATTEYLYTDAGKFEDPAVLFGKEIPFSFTTKSFVVKWDGTIKAGVQVDEITVEIMEDRKEIVVHIPKAKILSHEIDEESIETLDEKNGLFNSIKVDDIKEFAITSKDAMERRAVENGLLDRAFENAKEIIDKLIHTDVVEELEYTIVFEVIEE